VWPGITADPATDPRTRELGRWLCSVEKGVVSTTLPESEATWENSLLPDGVSTAWNLASVTTLPDGGLGAHYQRR
jgi:hypothetical protein